MKILHIISGRIYAGGAGRLVADLASEQVELGHDVTILSFKDSHEDLDISPKVKLLFYNEKGGSLPLSLSRFFAFYPIRICRLIVREHYEVVHCHLPAVFVQIIFSLIFLNTPRFFFTIHGNPIEEMSNKKLRDVRRFFINKKKLIPVAISKKIGECFSELYRVNHVDVIENGRKIQYPTQAYSAVKDEIAGYKLYANDIVCIFVGRIVREKNIGLLLDVFQRLYDDKIHAVLLILGEEWEKGLLQQLLTRKSNNVYFLGNKTNVIDYLLCSNVFCLSSLTEGLPIALIEAISVGLPVVSTTVGGIPDVIKNDENGLLLDTFAVDDYVLAMKKMIDFPLQKQMQMSENNKNIFNWQYNIIGTAKRYISLYEKYR